MWIWLTTAYYELVKYSRMRSLLIILIGLPLLLILVLGSAFDTEIKPAKVALYVADEGSMRASIDQYWDEDFIKVYIQVREANSEQEVKDLVQEGIVDYGVFVPSDFSQKIMTGKVSSWKTFSGRFEEKNIAADTVVNRYLTNVNLQLAAMTTLSPGSTAQSGNGLNSDAASDDSAIMIGTLGMGDNHIFGPSSAMQYYAAANLIMFLLFGGMSATLALLTEKESGTLQRMYALPASFRVIVFGIIVGAAMLTALQSMIIILFTKYVYDVEWGGQIGWMMLICLLTAAAGIGLGIIIASFVKVKKTVQTLYTILIFIMTFISGGMMAGIENLVGPAKWFTINYWATVSLRSIMNGSDRSSIGFEVMILALFAIVLSILAVIRLPKVVKQHV